MEFEGTPPRAFVAADVGCGAQARARLGYARPKSISVSGHRGLPLAAWDLQQLVELSVRDSWGPFKAGCKFTIRTIRGVSEARMALQAGFSAVSSSAGPTGEGEGTARRYRLVFSDTMARSRKAHRKSGQPHQ